MQQVPNSSITTQNVRDFTVAICNAVTHEIIGTGFVASGDGKIVTCRHVVLGEIEFGSVAYGVTVEVYFPQTKDTNLKR
jgi:sulfatase maturation enzyme AslB (radical SAM superfamily)